jgi:hypothetical protein
MLDLAANDPLIKTYLHDLQRLKSQSVTHELGLRGPFQTLLDKAAKKRGWTLIPELSTYSGGKRVVPDGTVRDEFRLAGGWWEAKDTANHPRGRNPLTGLLRSEAYPIGFYDPEIPSRRSRLQGRDHPDHQSEDCTLILLSASVRVG